MVDSSGVEPLTSALQMRRSNQLNYEPLYYFKPLTTGEKNQASKP